MTTKSKVDKELLEMDSYCPTCQGYIVGDGKRQIRYCSECGGKLVLPARCIICKGLLGGGNQFCVGCGFIAIR